MAMNLSIYRASFLPSGGNLFTCRVWANVRGLFAGIAQLVEQLICNQQVVGSNPTAGSLTSGFSEVQQKRRVDESSERMSYLLSG
jgi:hypothetical protein